MTSESAHPFHHVGVLAHPQRPETFPLADQIARWLGERGVATTVLTEWDQERACAGSSAWNLVISIGGDGNVLRAARVCAARGVPVLGVNMGRMGFLTEMSPSDWQDGLTAVLRGDYWLEDRLMIAAEWWCGEDLMCREEALNEAVVSRGAIARLVEFETYIDGAWTTTYRGDGLIVATPTGKY